jgi:hypothetical protein
MYVCEQTNFKFRFKPFFFVGALVSWYMYSGFRQDSNQWPSCADAIATRIQLGVCAVYRYLYVYVYSKYIGSRCVSAEVWLKKIEIYAQVQERVLHMSEKDLHWRIQSTAHILCYILLSVLNVYQSNDLTVLFWSKSKRKHLATIRTGIDKLKK